MRFRLIYDPDFFAFRRHSDGFHEGFSYYWFGATAAESNYLEIDVSALDARSLQFGAPGSQLVASVALRNCIDLSCDQWIAGISPLKGSSFFVVYSDEVHELFNQLLPGFENPAPDHFSGQNAKPNFNLV